MKVSCCWMYAIGKYGFPPTIDNMFKAIGEMADLGFEYLELEGLGYDNLSQVIEAAPEIKRRLDDAGVKLSNFAILLPDVISMDTALQAKAFEWFKRGVETAAMLGSPNVWIDSYAPPIEILSGKLFTQELAFGQEMRTRVPDGFSWPRFWENFTGAVKRCTEIAKASGLDLLVEPRVGEVTTNSEALIRLAEAVNEPNFGVIFDTAHQHAQKELLPLSVHKLGKLIRYVHVADNDGRDNHHFEMGHGNIDWDSVFESLKQIGFDGFFAVDLEKMPDLPGKFIQTKKKLEDYAAKYGL